MQRDPGSSGREIDDRLGLTGLLIVAALVRLFAWSRTAVLFNDGPIFLAMAEAIGRGDWNEVLAHPYHPLYPALTAAVAVLPVSVESAAIAVSIFGGLLAVGGLFVFARAALGREVAWIAAWVAALHPWAVDFSSDVMSDGLYAGLFVVGFAVMARMFEVPTVRSGMLCGACGGLAYLVRPEGAGLWIAALALLAVGAVRTPTRRPELARAGVGLLALAACIALPFVVAVAAETGEFALTQKKSVLHWVGLEEGLAARPTEAIRATTDLPLPELAVRADGLGARKPPRDIAGMIQTLERMTTTSLSAFRFELLPFALIGCWALRRAAPGRGLGWTIGLPILLYSALLGLLVWNEGYLSRRHALAPWVPAFALAALGAVELLAHRMPKRWRGSHVVVPALVVLIVMGWGARDLRPRRADRAAVREAAEWLAREHPGSGPVAAQKLRTAYYAGAEFVPLMPGHDGGLDAYLRRRGARWVVIDEDKLDDHLGLEAGIGSWLRPAHVVSEGPRRILVLALETEQPAH